MTASNIVIAIASLILGAGLVFLLDGAVSYLTVHRNMKRALRDAEKAAMRKAGENDEF